MDGDRSVSDRRDIFKSRVQEIIHDAWWGGWWDNQTEHQFGEWSYKKRKERVKYYLKSFDIALSNFDGSASDVGPKDETSEARAVGDRVRSKTYLKRKGIQTCVFDDLDPDPCQSITDELSKRISEAAKKAHIDPNSLIGHSEMIKKPDGSICVRIKYFQQNRR